jgi:D-alanyl-D-alanine carboxypeptidase
MMAFAATFAAVALASSSLWSSAPVLPEPAVEQPPELTARTWILYDADTGVVLAARDADQERAMASVTKIMTALVTIENAELDDRVRVSARAAAVGEAEIGLYAGELWTVRELLAAIMVRSANDAAVALAEHVGGSVEGFAAMMNEKAAQLGLEHSQFVNPHGLDAPDHYTSAADLVVMAEAALEHPYLAQLARTKLVTFRPTPEGVNRKAQSTNKLLGVYPGVVGLKTGFTARAALVLVGATEANGRKLISVVMGSHAHFDDTRKLVDYGLRSMTLRDRYMAPLVREEGGGATEGSLVPLSQTERARLMAVSPLPDGRWATTTFERTDLANRIRGWMLSVTPAAVGGP